MEAKILVRRACPKCGGAGEVEVEVAYCCLCGDAIPEDHPWWRGTDRVLPCGHCVLHLVEDMKRCPHCDGVGEVKEWVSLSEVARMLEEATDGEN